MNGGLAVLNVGAGDTKLSFDPEQPHEREHAAKIVTDMLKRGYAIMVKVDERDGEPVYRRVRSFDPKTCEYIVIGAPEQDAPAVGPRGKRRLAQTRVPASSTRGVAVARSAGGCARQ